MRPAYAFHSAHLVFSFFLRAFSLFFFLLHVWWEIASWKNGRRARQIIRFLAALFPSLASPSLPPCSVFPTTEPATTVLGCIRKANVIIHARILGVLLHHVWETCCATRHVVGGSCKLLLYSVCHFYDTGIKFLLYFLYYFYSSCTNPCIYDIQAALSLIMLSYKFIPRISQRRIYTWLEIYHKSKKNY